jgi:iron(III) transport system permease protein
MADPAIADGLPGLFRNPDFWRALKNTMLLVLLTSLFASGLGQIIGYICSRGRGTRRGRLVEQLTFIPYLIPSIAFGAMYLSMFAAPTRIELFGTSITIIPSLYATFTLLVLVSVVKHLPYASRSGTSNMMQISRELEEAGEVEGAGFGQRFVRLVMPLAKDGFLSGLMMILISVIKELDLIVMLISPKQETLSYIAYTFSNSGFTQMADGVAIVMFVIVFLLYWGADRFFHADITKGM